MTSTPPRLPSHPSDTPLDQARPLTEHLGEIRYRLISVFLFILIGSGVGWWVGPRLIDLLTQTTGPLFFFAPTEAFLVRIRLSLLIGVLLGTPAALYHVWRFVGVALTLSERRIVRGALPFSYGLFVMGVALGWAVIVPAGLKFLISFQSLSLEPRLSIEAVVRFALWTCLGLGLLFQIPVVLVALVSWGFVKAVTLTRYRRHALLGILIVSALVTPGPDVFSQLLLAVPTYLLCELSLWIARWVEPRE